MTTWVLFTGLPGTGKSTLANALQQRMDAATLNKDLVRSVLFPGSLTDYTQEQDDVCMGAMIDAAVYLTKRQRVEYIFFDGRTFSRSAHIEQVLRAAGRAGVRWRILHLFCADEVAEARLSRGDPAHPARNRDVSLYRRVKQDFEPIRYAKLDVDTTHGIEKLLDSAEAYLRSSQEASSDLQR
jgi:predicted kinase